MVDEHFLRELESTYAHNLPQELVEKWRNYEAAVYDRAEEIVKDLSPYVSIEEKRVLDVGSGYGGIAIALASKGAASVVGLEYDWNRIYLSDYRLKYDHTSDRVQLVQASGQNIPFSKDFFEVVVCSDVLEHVQDHRLLLKEIGRILKPGGWLYLKFPNLLSLTNLMQDPHYNLFGVSLMPPALGKWYVVDWRKVSPTYEVGTFPIASSVIRRLKQNDIQVTTWHPAPYRKIGFLTPLLRWYRLNTQGMMILICQKGE